MWLVKKEPDPVLDDGAFFFAAMRMSASKGADASDSFSDLERAQKQNELARLSSCPTPA
jgi:Tfp pilus assembly protein PilV